jgi:hypothetical protein
MEYQVSFSTGLRLSSTVGPTRKTSEINVLIASTDLFQTDHQDYNISKTSSYLDLSILYGDVQEEQDEMRTFKDGKIKADSFSESRLLAFPPACGTMLIMLNR